MAEDRNSEIGGAQILRVLLVDEDPARAGVLEAALSAAACLVVATVRTEDDLIERVRAAAPDIVIVGMDSPRRDTLESMRAITRDQPRPIVMFVDSSDSRMIEEAIGAGVSAYIVDGLNAKRVRPILDVAIAQFRECHALRTELERTKTSLKERKVIERAKGILMEQKHLSEEDAYRTLRRLAMDQNKRLVDVAQGLITYAQLLQG
jgi:response regulator NasT